MQIASMMFLVPQAERVVETKVEQGGVNQPSSMTLLVPVPRRVSEDKRKRAEATCNHQA